MAARRANGARAGPIAGTRRSFAGAGYVVVMPNPRGSIGYGQKFTDDINQDWGGKPYDDIMAVTDYVAKLPYVDADRMAAAGGSYGGYMINWILGHTNRFKCSDLARGRLRSARRSAEHRRALVSHLGIRRHAVGQSGDLRQMVAQPLRQRISRRPRWSSTANSISASLTRRASNSTPRCRCAKCLRSCSSFPDEGHWVLKPQNSAFWYKTFLDWVGNWTK